MPCQGRIQEFLIGGVPGIVGSRGVFGGLPQKKIEISGSEKCILVDPGDGFAMDNGESKKPSGLIGGSGPPLTLPLDPPLPAYC